MNTGKTHRIKEEKKEMKIKNDDKTGNKQVILLYSASFTCQVLQPTRYNCDS
jgi:hypothetical protein